MLILWQKSFLYPPFENYTTHINLMRQINFRLIAEALKRDYPSKFASKTMVENQNEFVKMQSLVAAYDAGKVIHPEYYKNLKKGAHYSHLGSKNGLVPGRLASL